MISHVCLACSSPCSTVYIGAFPLGTHVELVAFSSHTLTQNSTHTSLEMAGRVPHPLARLFQGIPRVRAASIPTSAPVPVPTPAPVAVPTPVSSLRFRSPSLPASMSRGPAEWRLSDYPSKHVLQTASGKNAGMVYQGLFLGGFRVHLAYF